MTELVFGGDSSKWDDIDATLQRPDFQKAYDNGWRFNYLKATQGLWIDQDFRENWAACRKTELALGVFHFLQWDISPEKQAEFFWSIVKDDTGELPLVVDFEWWSTIPSTAFDILYRFLERLKQLCNGKAIAIYTAYSFWKQYGKIDAYWKQYLLWLAWYQNTEPTGPTQIPAPWTEYFLWQYTGHGDGIYYGMESKDVDLDWMPKKYFEQFTNIILPPQGEASMWKDKPLGITIDGTMNVDFATLKTQGLSFVVIQAGVGFDPNPQFANQMSAAKVAGLPILVEYVPMPAIDDYTFAGVPQAQLVELRKWLANKTFNGIVISVERWWTGKDLETNHVPVRPAGDIAINNTAKTIVDSLAAEYGPKSILVFVRTNDSFVQGYSKSLGMGWTDKFGFVLADWRYRTADASGAYTIYTSYPGVATPVADLAVIRTVMPPDNSKNPLVPGSSPQLRFWEFSGNRYVLPTVKSWVAGSTVRVRVSLFNGDNNTLNALLSCTTPPVPVIDPKLEERIKALEVNMAANNAVIKEIEDNLVGLSKALSAMSDALDPWK